MKADKKRVRDLIEHWIANPPKRGIGLLIPRAYLEKGILELLVQARSDGYSSGYDDGFQDGTHEAGLE